MKIFIYVGTKVKIHFKKGLEDGEDVYPAFNTNADFALVSAGDMALPAIDIDLVYSASVPTLINLTWVRYNFNFTKEMRYFIPHPLRQLVYVDFTYMLADTIDTIDSLWCLSVRIAVVHNLVR